MAVQPNTRRESVTVSDVSGAMRRNGAKIQSSVQQGERRVEQTAHAVEQRTNKMVDTGLAALSDGITRSEKVADDAHDYVSASLSPDMVQKFPAIGQMIDGVHDLQVESAEVLRRYIDRSIQTHRQLLHSRSLLELSSLHQRYVMDNMDDFAAISRSALDISAKLAEQCAGDLTRRFTDASAAMQRKAGRL